VASDNNKQFDETNRWKLFRNTEKKGERSPDFSGEVNIDGAIYRLNGWVQEGNGKKFFSGTVAPKQTPVASSVVDDDVPF
jgi:hypothetical protein